MENIQLFIATGIAAALWLVPWHIAARRKHPNRRAIAAFNLLILPGVLLTIGVDIELSSPLAGLQAHVAGGIKWFIVLWGAALVWSLTTNR